MSLALQAMAKAEEKLEGFNTCFEEECHLAETAASWSDLVAIQTRVLAIRHAYARVATRLAGMQSELSAQ